MPKLVEERFISEPSIRMLCEENNWFTKGTKDQFEAFLDKWEGKNLTTLDLMEMAEELAKFSTSASYIDMELTDMVWSINHRCSYHFEVVDDA